MTPREPDLAIETTTDQRARALSEQWLIPRDWIAAALRAEHEAALNEAATFVESGSAADISLATAGRIAARLRALASPAAAPAATPFTPTQDELERSDLPWRPAASQPSEPVAPAPSEAEPPRSPDWRIGNHYGIHVYCGEVPIATFHTVLDARRCVDAVNAAPAQRAEARIAELEALVAEANRQLAALAARTSQSGAGEGTT